MCQPFFRTHDAESDAKALVQVTNHLNIERLPMSHWALG
ncbi:hypothetical protein VTO7225_02459 [Vibrio toranzoniae]|jgi:hypothetical protein|nr:hypothetical protein VTO7225_02459 [Vibrio toranzoniae]